MVSSLRQQGAHQHRHLLGNPLNMFRLGDGSICCAAGEADEGVAECRGFVQVAQNAPTGKGLETQGMNPAGLSGGTSREYSVCCSVMNSRWSALAQPLKSLWRW